MRNCAWTPRSLVVSPGATRLISVALTVFHEWKLVLGARPIKERTFRTTPSVPLSGLSSDATHQARASQYLIFAAGIVYHSRLEKNHYTIKKTRVLL